MKISLKNIVCVALLFSFNPFIQSMNQSFEDYKINTKILEINLNKIYVIDIEDLAIVKSTEQCGDFIFKTCHMPDGKKVTLCEMKDNRCKSGDSWILDPLEGILFEKNFNRSHTSQQEMDLLKKLMMKNSSNI
ncbi:hypothetical protein H0X06_03650 [Candidatus Dependentiae bacterium]|nr:hypothetical protein [Candidatus Dependentiae bacterium]